MVRDASLQGAEFIKDPRSASRRHLFFFCLNVVSPCECVPSFLRSRRVRGHHGVLEAAVPAAALAFAAAAAAPGSAAAPPSGLSHGVSTGPAPLWPCAPGSVRGFCLLGRGRRLGGFAEAGVVLRAPGTRGPCLGVPKTPTLLGREPSAAPALPSPPGSTWRPAKRGSSQDGGVAGRRPRRESWGGVGGAGRPEPDLDMRVGRLPLLAGWGTAGRPSCAA